ncbi:MAG: hypothetical protein IMW90_09010, partial [Thermogemmatispora sp.]|uniref:hypothetical protein n=1 Tax=Thermogemmatispora sp. TaxID=1968838 RepID=UPI0019F1AFFE
MKWEPRLCPGSGGEEEGRQRRASRWVREGVLALRADGISEQDQLLDSLAGAVVGGSAWGLVIACGQVGEQESAQTLGVGQSSGLSSERQKRVKIADGGSG